MLMIPIASRRLGTAEPFTFQFLGEKLATDIQLTLTKTGVCTQQDGCSTDFDMIVAAFTGGRWV
jgi:hypothetical protein